jgi:hypothetical protein
MKSESWSIKSLKTITYMLPKGQLNFGERIGIVGNEGLKMRGVLVNVGEGVWRCATKLAMC